MINPEVNKKAIELILDNPSDYLIEHEWYRDSLKEFVGGNTDREFGEYATDISHIKITNQTALGRIWHFVSNDEDVIGGSIIQVVFPKPIPARFIERIVPLYRSNKRYKEIKDKVTIDSLD